MSMFCNQCQEAKGNFACTSQGICGKSSDLSNLQDLLVFLCQELSEIIYSEKIESTELDRLNKIIIDSLFMTITNANFDESFIKSQILKLVEERNLLVEKYSVFRDDLININPTNIEELSTTIKIFNIDDEDKKSLSQLIVYGIKGLAAYLHHARNLGYEDKSIYDFLYLALAKSSDKNSSMDELFNLSLETGKYGVKAMELLDMANTKTFGHPEVTDINIGVRNRPAILVSGHDLKDLKDLLDQSKDQGIDVYTHSEMLAAHSYPIFKEYDHFVGNYGNAWWQQAKEFKSFNGPILFTTNCIVPPKDEEIKDRIFTTGPSAYPGTKYIGPDKNGNKDFSEIINLAKKLASPEEIESGYIKGGFAHNQVFELADQVIGEIEKGNIKKFFVMAGCDGRMKSRSYYTDFAKGLDSNTIILTAGCAKYRYNKLDLGDINGIPRLLDAGQCNDSYSLVLIALKLQETLNLENINDLPIEYNISWYEQKAVIVLLSLLYLGVKDIYLGPSLPAFLSENILNILVDKFGISAISSVDKDLEYLMNK